MKRNLAYITLWIIVLVVVSSCRKEGRGTITKVLDARNFTKIEIAGEFDIRVVQGAAFDVRIIGREKDLAELEIKLFDELLLMEYPHFSLFRKRGKIFITMPSLTNMVFAGPSNVTVEGFTASETVFAETSGESRLQVNMHAPVFRLRASALSEITLKGTANELTAETSGAAMIDAYQVPVVKATTLAHSNSQMKVHAMDWLIATATGNSFIYFRGNPVKQDFTRIGEGKIVKE